MAGQVEGWDISENGGASWARNKGRTVDMTIDADGMTVEIEYDCHDGGGHTVDATIPIAVLREVLRRVDAKGAR